MVELLGEPVFPIIYCQSAVRVEVNKRSITINLSTISHQ